MYKKSLRKHISKICIEGTVLQNELLELHLTVNLKSKLIYNDKQDQFAKDKPGKQKKNSPFLEVAGQSEAGQLPLEARRTWPSAHSMRTQVPTNGAECLAWNRAGVCLKLCPKVALSPTSAM